MPKMVDPAEKRAELVAASWVVIAAEGLKGATLRKVAAQAGCTTGALTHYFPDRHALLVAALRAAHFQAGARMFRAAGRASSDLESLKAVLLESLPLDEPRRHEWRVWLAFWAESMTEGELADENVRRYAEWRDLLRKLVGRLLPSESEVDHEVSHLIALVDGLGLGLVCHASPDSVFELRQRECTAMLMRQLARFETE